MPGSMFSGLPTTAPRSTSAFAPEPIEGNSLTRYLRSLTNSMAPQSQQYSNYGQQILGAALPGFETASGTTEKGLQTMQPSVDYWTKILSGDEKSMISAVAPQVQQIQAGYQGALQSASKNAPRGGYAATIQAQLPFQQAREVSNLFSQLQPQAAQMLINAAQTQGSIAEVQARISQALGQLGLSQTELGQQIMQLLMQSLLGERGQDVQEKGQAMGLAGQLGSSFMNLLSNIKPR